MRIGIDGTPVVGTPAGVGRYTRMIIEKLARAGRDQLNVFLPGLYPFNLRTIRCAAAELESLPGVQVTHARWPYTFLRSGWKNIGWPRVEMWLKGIDVFHGTNHYLPPLKRAAGVLTIYDVSFLTHPESHTKSEARQLTSHLKASFRRSRRIVTISHFTKMEFLRFFDYPAEKVHAIPLAPAERFRVLSDRNKLEEVRLRFKLPMQFVLSVATIQPRKNLMGLIRAFHRAQHALPGQCELILCGQTGWLYEPIFELVRQLKLESRVRFLGYVADEDLVAVYNLASSFVYVPFYEGFGLPPLEAMACGIPVICSDNSSLPEVIGDAALRVRAEDEPAIAAALSRLIGDSELRNQLRCRGLEQARSFAWQETADETRKVYEAAVGDLG